MNSLNKVQLIGNLTADPEIRETTGGQIVANFSIATNKTRNNRETGEKIEQVEYHNVTAWWKLAEIIQTYLTKGKKVFVEGELQTRSWDDEQGVKRYRTSIVINQMIMLNGNSQQAAYRDENASYGEEGVSAQDGHEVFAGEEENYEEEAPAAPPKRPAARPAPAQSSTGYRPSTASHPASPAARPSAQATRPAARPAPAPRRTRPADDGIHIEDLPF